MNKGRVFSEVLFPSDLKVARFVVAGQPVDCARYPTVLGEETTSELR